jgi:DNA-binding NarL/FixJ family response regulator
MRAMASASSSSIRLQLVAEELGNREIAEMLALSEHTVKHYLFHIFDKLEISNHVELVSYAVSNPKGTLTAPSPQEKPLAKAAGPGA